MPGRHAETSGYRRPRAKHPRLPTPRLRLQLPGHRVISSILPSLPRTVAVQRAPTGLYIKLPEWKVRAFFLYRCRALAKNHWTRRNVRIAFIKRTALLVNLLLLLLRCIAAWTPEICSKISKRLLPSTATPPCAVCLKIVNASHISTAVATAGLPCTPAAASRQDIRKKSASLCSLRYHRINNNNNKQRATNTDRVQRTEVSGLPRLYFRNLSR